MSGGLPVYVAAPCERADEVRKMHFALLFVGCKPVSHWANLAKGVERLETMSRGEIRSAIEVNDASLRSASVVLALTRRGRGGETFCEIARAIEWGIPVLWAGEHVLSAYRSGVWLCDPPQLAIDVLNYVVGFGGDRCTPDRAGQLCAQFFGAHAHPSAAVG